MNEMPEQDLPPASVVDRMIALIHEPAILFRQMTHVKPLPRNWVVPPLAALLVAMLTTSVLFLRPDVAEDIKRMQRLGLYQQVEAGELTPAELSDALRVVEERGNTLALIPQAIVLPLYMIATVAWWALILWIAADLLGGRGLDYYRALELSGLVMTIDILKYLVFAIASTWMGRIAVPNAAILISQFDATKKLHLLIGSLDPFNCWKVVLLGLGVASCSGVSRLKSIACLVGILLLLNLALVALGLGELAQ